MIFPRLSESRASCSQQPGLVRSIVIFGACSAAVLVAASLVVRTSDPPLAFAIFRWTMPLILVYVLFVMLNLPLLRGPSGSIQDRLGTANALTALRLFLVPPILVLLFGGHVVAGSILYLLAALTDVADGIAARRLGEETTLGIMLDPVGDIAITAGVFSYFFSSGDVPIWLFIILIFRYTQFFAGIALLVRAGSIPELKATAAGKTVGIVQAVGIAVILAAKIEPSLVPVDRVGRILYPLLAAAFGSVIVSQTVIGWRALRGIGRRNG